MTATQPISIRKAWPRDLDEVRAIFGEYAGTIPHKLCFQQFDDELRTLPGRYAEPGGVILLAGDAGAPPLACVAMRALSTPGCCEMKRLYVKPAARGAKLGRRLCEGLIHYARGVGYQRMRLDTLPSLEAAWGLYHALGFREIERYYDNPIPEARYLELDFSRAPRPGPPLNVAAGTILLATRNAGKLRELRELTADDAWNWIGLDSFADIPEAPETGDSFGANARQKARYYAAVTGLTTLADDSGLEVDALDGAPGVQSAYFAGAPSDDAANNRLLMERLGVCPDASRAARFRCAMALAAPEGAILAETAGVMEGAITTAPRGENGFGYDPHFLVADLGCTSAELAPAEKNARSHRGQALRAMLTKLRASMDLSDAARRPAV